MIERKSRSCVNWQKTLKQKRRKTNGRKTRAGVFWHQEHIGNNMGAFAELGHEISCKMAS
jgi:hypothetical protein